MCKCIKFRVLFIIYTDLTIRRFRIITINPIWSRDRLPRILRLNFSTTTNWKRALINQYECDVKTGDLTGFAQCWWINNYSSKTWWSYVFRAQIITAHRTVGWKKGDKFWVQNDMIVILIVIYHSVLWRKIPLNSLKILKMSTKNNM